MSLQLRRSRGGAPSVQPGRWRAPPPAVREGAFPRRGIGSVTGAPSPRGPARAGPEAPGLRRTRRDGIERQARSKGAIRADLREGRGEELLLARRRRETTFADDTGGGLLRQSMSSIRACARPFEMLKLFVRASEDS